MPTKPILVCGDSMWDEYIWGEVERISPEAPVPVVRVVKEELKSGAANNVIANIVALGGRTHNVTHVGCRKLRIIARNQHICRVDFDNFEPITEKILRELGVYFLDRLDDCDVVVFSDYAKGALQNIQKWLEAASSKLTLVDPKGIDYAKYKGATLIKPNTAELQAAVGGWRDETHLWEKTRALLAEHSIRYMLLTRASHGASLMNQEEKIDFPSHSAEVYDVTGAGDTVIATLAHCLNENMPMHKSVQYAIKAAGITVCHLGAYAPTAKEVFSND